jgi:tRNA 2-thiocytidine biosynthesis protein TtcA
MLQEWDKSHPGRVESIFRSIGNVSLSQLADTSNFPFTELKAEGLGSNNLDVVELV